MDELSDAEFAALEEAGRNMQRYCAGPYAGEDLAVREKLTKAGLINFFQRLNYHTYNPNRTFMVSTITDLGNQLRLAEKRRRKEEHRQARLKLRGYEDEAIF